MYYRLSVIPIQLPALRERREDIPLLARHFLETFRKAMEKPINGISPEAMRRLEEYDWPGNVRELENTMERAVALESGPEISLPVLPDRIAGYSAVGGATGPALRRKWRMRSAAICSPPWRNATAFGPALPSC